MLCNTQRETELADTYPCAVCNTDTPRDDLEPIPNYRDRCDDLVCSKCRDELEQEL